MTRNTTTTTQLPTPTSRINKLLKQAGHEIKLVRGRGYYYLIDTGSEHHMISQYSTSIYVFWLERTEKDFKFARSEVNEILTRAKLATI
jgi:hypothetical protein